jgi:hypothetical protein
MFSGAIEKAKLIFKIGKKETDIKEEAAIQNNQNNQKDISNSGPSSIENNNHMNVNPEHIELDIGGGNKNMNFNSGDNNNNYKFPSNVNVKYLDNEEKLD